MAFLLVGSPIISVFCNDVRIGNTLYVRVLPVSVRSVVAFRLVCSPIPELRNCALCLVCIGHEAVDVVDTPVVERRYQSLTYVRNATHTVRRQHVGNVRQSREL